MLLDDPWIFFLIFSFVKCFVLGVLGLQINSRGRVGFNFSLCVCVCFALNGW